MCKHNDIDDYDCVDCAYHWGYFDGVYDNDYNNEYKDAWQAEDYTKGYNQALEDVKNDCIDHHSWFL